ncbi:MAG: HlyD family efflux transporter periplasmic adaptor subunit [Planctomycetota bacterium]|nr:MAG: HlyD family efflux transporter periplasmic adaptor subunit [Planctomycetota bacterium]
MPVAGQIASVAVEPHAQVAPGQTLFTLHDTSRLEIPVAVPVSRALLLAPGLRAPSGGAGAGRSRIEATITPSAVVGGPRWSGTVQRFEPIDATAQTVPAVVELAPRPGEDPPPVGLFCSVELRGGPALPGPFVPRAALYEGGVVWTVQDGKLAARRVETGAAFGDWVEVRAGLEGVDEVIVSPLERPLPGEPARRLGAGAQGPGAAARAAGSGAGGA